MKRFRARGFTLVELTIALVLLALIASVLYGALGFAGTTWDRGEAKVDGQLAADADIMSIVASRDMGNGNT